VVRDRVDQRDEGDGEPDDVSVTCRRAAVLLAVAAAVSTGCGSGASSPAEAPTTQPGRHFVLISGRDDHGLLAQPRVPLYDRPSGTREVAEVADGTLARVVQVRGSWLEVEPLAAGSATGWSDDYYLRGVVHLVGPAPSCRVTVDGRRVAAGEQAIVLDVRGATATVRLVRAPSVTGSVPARYVRELPPSPDDPCPRS
jgi:hypothetical protein